MLAREYIETREFETLITDSCLDSCSTHIIDDTSDPVSRHCYGLILWASTMRRETLHGEWSGHTDNLAVGLWLVVECLLLCWEVIGERLEGDMRHCLIDET